MKRLKPNASDLRWFWVGSALAGLGTLTLSFASIPLRGRVTDDSALYDQISEIRVSKTRGHSGHH